MNLTGVLKIEGLGGICRSLFYFPGNIFEIRREVLMPINDPLINLSQDQIICAASVSGSIASIQEEGRGSNPTAALHYLAVRPIPFVIAKELIQRNHYLHSLPGGTMLCFGIFMGERLLGALTLGAGPYQAYHLVEHTVCPWVDWTRLHLLVFLWCDRKH